MITIGMNARPSDKTNNKDDHLDCTLTKQSLKALSNATEREYILQILQAVDWQIVKAAQFMQIDRSTLFRKMKKHGIKHYENSKKPNNCTTNERG